MHIDVCVCVDSKLEVHEAFTTYYVCTYAPYIMLKYVSLLFTSLQWWRFTKQSLNKEMRYIYTCRTSSIKIYMCMMEMTPSQMVQSGAEPGEETKTPQK